jgi:hypothetical protein
MMEKVIDLIMRGVISISNGSSGFPPLECLSNSAPHAENGDADSGNEKDYVVVMNGCL